MFKILLVFIIALIFQLISPDLTLACGLLTHIELMNQTIKVLGNEFKYILDTFLLYATLGAIGPDIFRGSLFKKLHGKGWIQFVYGMLDYLKNLAPGEKRNKLTVYLYGYLTHLAGDINADTLAHRISNQQEHNRIFNQVYFHQDLYIACKYHSTGGNRANPMVLNHKIDLYELDIDIIQMFRIVFDKLQVHLGEGGVFELEWKTFISAYDRTRLFLWWLIKEANQPLLRIFLPYNFGTKYLLKFEQSFEDSKQTAAKFIQSANEFLYTPSWSTEEYNKLKEIIKEDYVGCPYM